MFVSSYNKFESKDVHKINKYLTIFSVKREAIDLLNPSVGEKSGLFLSCPRVKTSGVVSCSLHSQQRMFSPHLYSIIATLNEPWKKLSSVLTPRQIPATTACIDLTVQINSSLDLQALLSLSLWEDSELAETSTSALQHWKQSEIPKQTGNLAGMRNLRPEFQNSSF